MGSGSSRLSCRDMPVASRHPTSEGEFSANVCSPVAASQHSARKDELQQFTGQSTAPQHSPYNLNLSNTLLFPSSGGPMSSAPQLLQRGSSAASSIFEAPGLLNSTTSSTSTTSTRHCRRPKRAARNLENMRSPAPANIRAGMPCLAPAAPCAAVLVTVPFQQMTEETTLAGGSHRSDDTESRNVLSRRYNFSDTIRNRSTSPSLSERSQLDVYDSASSLLQHPGLPVDTADECSRANFSAQGMRAAQGLDTLLSDPTGHHENESLYSDLVGISADTDGFDTAAGCQSALSFRSMRLPKFSSA